MSRRSFLSSALIAGVAAYPFLASGQNLSIGLIGGASLTDAARDVTRATPGYLGTRVWSQSKDWQAGAALEYRVRPWLSLELDGIYHELHITWAGVEPDGSLNSVSPSPVVTWEFPVLLKHRFRSGGWRPFVEGGPAFRTTGNLNFTPTHYGAAAGFGVEKRWGAMSFAPVVRYTRWARERSNGSFGSLQPNQVEVLLAIGRASESSFHPAGSRVSLGAVAGWGLTGDYRAQSYRAQGLVAVPQPGGGFTYDTADGTQYLTGARSLIAGPSVEFHATQRFSVEVDALHKPLRSRGWMVLDNGIRYPARTATTAATWQFPLLAKYRLRWGRANPFVEAGPSFRLPQWDLSTYGAAAGAGIDVRLGALKFSPAVRWTHWGAGGARNGVARNEASVLAGFSFGGPRAAQ
jgi:hypothetical protein